MQSDWFETRRNEMRQESARHRRGFKIWFAAILIIGVVGVLTQGFLAYRAGCLESMILNRVCLSTPAIDDAVRKVIKQ